MRTDLKRIFLKILELSGLAKLPSYRLTVNRQTKNIENFKINLQAGEAKRFTFQGKEKLIVPVIMLKQTVVNGSLVTVDELHPETWNGVPVTLNHPTDERGEYVSANSPEMVVKFEVGRIFKAKMDDDKLKAEAWLDIASLNEHDKDLLTNLESGVEMDVSTGYFSERIEQNGSFNGQDYFDLAKNIKPDHLALLPYSEGACSFDDGCGVRANRVLETAENALSDLKDSSIENFLSVLRDKFLSQNDSDSMREAGKLISNLLQILTQKEVNNVSEKDKKLEVQKQDCQCESLSSNDKEALEFAKNFYEEAKSVAIKQLVANGFDEKELEGFKVNQLQLMAKKFEKTESPKEVQANDNDEKEELETNNEKVSQPSFKGRGFAQKKVSSNKIDYSQMAKNTGLNAFKKEAS